MDKDYAKKMRWLRYFNHEYNKRQIETCRLWWRSLDITQTMSQRNRDEVTKLGKMFIIESELNVERLYCDVNI